MDCGIERAVGTDEDVLADDDGGDVEGGEPKVDPGAVAASDVVTVVDAQGRANIDALAHRSDNLGEQVARDVGVGRVRLLVQGQEPHGTLGVGGEHIVGHVEVAVRHALGGCALVVAKTRIVEGGSRCEGHATRVVDALSSRGARRASR